MNKKLIIGLVILLGLSGCRETDKNRPHNISAFEKVRLTDLKNQIVDLNQYKGKAIFLNFWATWCKPCIREMASIEKAQETLQNENIVFLVASGESGEEIELFIKGHDYKLNYMRVENSDELNIQALPTTFIFNQDHELVFSEAGFKQWDDQANIGLIKNILK